jgi:hypothetical protein
MTEQAISPLRRRMIEDMTIRQRLAVARPAVAGRCAMNTLCEALQEYLTLRWSLGFKFRDAARVLSRFVAFMEERQAPHITTKLALEWVQLAQTVQPAERARRLCFMRDFARHRSATDSLIEVPPRELYPYRSTRVRPYLYSEQEVKDLPAAALRLPTGWPSTGCDRGYFIAFWVYSASRACASPKPSI